jgi:hypothetical protein
MAARCDPAEQAGLGIDLEPLPVAWPGEQVAREPKGERRFANAARSAQQDRVRQPLRLDEPAQLALGARMTEKLRVLPRCEHASRSFARCPSPSR